MNANVDPYKALKKLGLGIEDAPAFRQSYIDKYPVGHCAHDRWNEPSFTLGFEYGMLATAAFLESVSVSGFGGAKAGEKLKDELLDEKEEGVYHAVKTIIDTP